jgi:hypothetical protein
LAFTSLDRTTPSLGKHSLRADANPAQHYFNGTVSFSATDAGGGNVTFSVTANANWVSPFTHYTIGPAIMAGENSTWNNMLSNVQRYCKSPIGK